MKNVTGLDLVKLICGAHGTLGLVTEATFKLLPKPQSEATIVIRRLDDERAVAAMTRALGSPFGVSGAAAIGAGMGREFPRTFLRVEGFAESVDYRAERLIALLADFGAKHALRGEEFAAPVARGPRRRIPRRAARARDLARQPSRRRRRRASSRASARSALSHFYDWGGGLVWLASEPTEGAAAAVRAALAPLGGHATLVRAPDALRARVDVFEPLSPALARLTQGREGELRPGRIVQFRPHDCAERDGRCKPTFPPSGSPTRICSRWRRSCAPACIAASAPRPARPICHRRRARKPARAHLSHQGLAGDRARATAEDVAPIDHCLSCLSCMTTCPSGVDYRRLVDHARVAIETTYKRPLRRPPDARRAGVAAALARAVSRRHGSGRDRPAVRADPGARSRPRRQARGDAGAGPQGGAGALRGRRAPANSRRRRPGAKRRRVALLTGCAQDALAPQINAATIRLLNRAGIDVVLPKGEGCCGSLLHHMGRERKAARSGARQRRRLDSRGRRRRPGGDRRHRLGLRRDDQGLRLHAARRSRLRGKGARASPRSRGTSANTSPASNWRSPIRRSSSSPITPPARCSTARRSSKRPRRCCAAPASKCAVPRKRISAAARRAPTISCNRKWPRNCGARKVANLARVKPDVIAAGNIGCLAQIASGTTTPVVHTVELLDWASGGPAPAGLG